MRNFIITVLFCCVCSAALANTIVDEDLTVSGDLTVRDAMYIDSSNGNVGIGALSVPDATLDVTGDVYIDDVLSVSNVLYVEDNGNVGIGTVSPATDFEIVGDLSMMGNLTISTNASPSASTVVYKMYWATDGTVYRCATSGV